MPELKDEKELEDYLFKVYQQDTDGFTTLRQVGLSVYGVADIIRFRATERDNGFKILYVEVIELKKGKIGFGELAQLLRYKTALSRYFNANDDFGYDAVELSAELIGSDIEMGGDFVYLINEFSDSNPITLTTYKITLDAGITFEQANSGWYKPSEKLDDIKLSIPVATKSNVLPLKSVKPVEFSG